MVYILNMSKADLSTFLGTDPLRDAVDYVSHHRRGRKSRDKEAVTLDPTFMLPLEVREIVEMRIEDGRVIAPSENNLEAGLRTLAGELTNDAISMLKQDQELGSYDVKRRMYMATVLGHVTKTVHGSASLKLKAAAEKRATTTLFVDLLAKASAGTLTDEELKRLKNG